MRVHKIGWWLIVIGAINWGLVGLSGLLGNAAANLNIVHMILGTSPQLENLVYVLVGGAGVAMLTSNKK
jgi:uncharacterized protein